MSDTVRVRRAGGPRIGLSRLIDVHEARALIGSSLDVEVIRTAAQVWDEVSRQAPVAGRRYVRVFMEVQYDEEEGSDGHGD